MAQNTNTPEGKSVIVSEKVRLGNELGSGSESTVYQVEGSSTVAKIFDEEYRDEKTDKIWAMIDSPPDDPTYDSQGVRSIFWPEAVVSDTSGSVLGYKMPYRELANTKNAFRYATTELAWDESRKSERYTTALNLARVVEAIHREGHAIGNFNHDNILVENSHVSLIDCDAFHITGDSTEYPNKTYHPRYSLPGKRGGTVQKVQQNDRFSLGVHIFQFLMEGNHPYQAQGDDAEEGSWEDTIQENPFPYAYDGPQHIEPHEQAPSDHGYNQLPKQIRELFERCFNETEEGHTNRPKPEEWITALTEYTSVTGQDQDEEADDEDDSLEPVQYSSSDSSEEKDELTAVDYDNDGESAGDGSNDTGLESPYAEDDDTHAPDVTEDSDNNPNESI